VHKRIDENEAIYPQGYAKEKRLEMVADDVVGNWCVLAVFCRSDGL
jgi:hypothetical protein